MNALHSYNDFLNLDNFSIFWDDDNCYMIKIDNQTVGYLYKEGAEVYYTVTAGESSWILGRRLGLYNFSLLGEFLY